MKLGMIGYRGHWGYVFDSIREVPQVDLCAISAGCDDNPEPLQSRAKEFGFSPKRYDNYLEMLDQAELDIVCIDGPFDLHAKMSIEALKRDIHVFCEKPIALNLEDLAQIEKVKNNSSAKIISMVGLRYDPAFLYAAKLVHDGAIGKVKLIKAQKSYRLGTRPDFYKKRSTYGGTIPWVGSHAIDWIMYFSKSEIKSVWANQTSSDNFDNGDLEIAAQCQFTMKNGVMASASIDFLRPAKAPTHGDDRIRVAGTKGVIEVIDGEINLINDNGANNLTVPPADRMLFSDFILDLTGTRKGLVDSAETFALTRACLLAQKSADTGEIIYA